MEKTANLELALINPSEWATTYSKDFLNALMGVGGSSNMSKIDNAVAALEEAVRTIPSPITGETVTAKATVGISKGNVVRLELLDGAYIAAMATSTTEATQYWLGIADSDIAAEQTGSVTMVVAVTSHPSVYQQAVAAGYTGTAEDFGRALANIDKKPDAKEVSFSGAESGMVSADVQAAIEEVHAEAINKSTTASNVSFDPSRTTMKSTTAQDAFVELFTNVSDGKRQVASAVTDKGVPTSEDATFSTIAEHVRSISTGTDTSDADITAADVRSGKVGYGKDVKIVGAAPDVAVPTPVISVSSGGLITASATQNTGFVAGGSANATQQLPTQNALTIQPRTFTQSVQGQHYLLGDIDVLGDANLQAANIRRGTSIFGISGTYEGSGAIMEPLVTARFGMSISSSRVIISIDTQRNIQKLLSVSILTKGSVLISGPMVDSDDETYLYLYYMCSTDAWRASADYDTSVEVGSDYVDITLKPGSTKISSFQKGLMEGTIVYIPA